MSSLSDRSVPAAESVPLPIARPDTETAAQEIAAALAVTRTLFGGEPTFEAEFDPDNPDHEWIAFEVTAGGTTHERIDRQLEWHERIEAVIPNHIGRYCLSIIPIDETC